MKEPDTHLHYKIYKPVGMLSQFHSNDTKESRKKRFLTDIHTFPDNLMPIGRLDEKSEGLLVLTTDGKLSDTINRAGIEKQYVAQLDGLITEEAITLLQNGVTIGIHGKKYITKSCSVEMITTPKVVPAHTSLRIGRHRPTSWISITITEGKFRQIRKMTAAVGFPTVRLIRVRIGTISLDNMQPGEFQQLSTPLCY